MRREEDDNYDEKKNTPKVFCSFFSFDYDKLKRYTLIAIKLNGCLVIASGAKMRQNEES